MTAQPRSESFGIRLDAPSAVRSASMACANAPADISQADEGAGGSLHHGVYRDRVKRLLDVVLVLVSLPVTVPLIALAAALVSLQGGRPFYTQPRVGRGGALFRMWKLRTMEVGAEHSLETHLARDPALRAEWDAHQKLRRDPRITRIGQFLRKSSLDELPQIWNILRGDMSLVGPRPMMPFQRALYSGSAYYRLRPGLTGLWQVSARNDSVFAYRAACDSRYERRMSLLLDVKLILFTFVVVFRGTGQ